VLSLITRRHAKTDYAEPSLPLDVARMGVIVHGSTQELLSRLAKGPAFLFLGQASVDPLFDAGALSRIETADRERGEDRLLAIGKAADKDVIASYQAIEEETRSSPAPEWLKEIASFPWNGVFTTRVDSAVAVAFEASWRRVVPTAQVQVGRHPTRRSRSLVWQTRRRSLTL
jgi:hypothetical protein